MTRNILFAITLFAIFIPTAHSSAQSFPDTAWMKLYGGSGSDFGTDIKQTFDGGFIAMGRSDSDDGDLTGAPTGNKQWILKLDSLGNIEWEQHYAGINEYSMSIIQTKDSGYIFGMPFITKLDQDGSIAWQSTVNAFYVIQTKDGGYAALRDGTITKLDAAGNTMWTHQSIFQGGIVTLKTYDIRETLDSSLVFCGNWREDVWTYGGWLVKTDKNGNELYNNNSWGLQFNAMKVAQDDSLFLCAWGGYNNYQKLGTWQRSINGVSVTDVMENVDSSIVLSSFIKLNSSDTLYDSKIFKITPSGDTIISTMIGGNRSDILNKVNPTKNNGYVAIGSSRSWDGNFAAHRGQWDVWIVKYKEDTSVHIPQPTTIRKAQLKKDIVVYPSLTKGIVNIEIANFHDHVVLYVLNSAGEEIFRRQADPKQTIDLNGHAPGLYILCVEDADHVNTFKLMLEQ